MSTVMRKECRQKNPPPLIYLRIRGSSGMNSMDSCREYYPWIFFCKKVVMGHQD